MTSVHLRCCFQHHLLFILGVICTSVFISPASFSLTSPHGNNMWGQWQWSLTRLRDGVPTWESISWRLIDLNSWWSFLKEIHLHAWKHIKCNLMVSFTAYNPLLFAIMDRILIPWVRESSGWWLPYFIKDYFLQCGPNPSALPSHWQTLCCFMPLWLCLCCLFWIRPFTQPHGEFLPTLEDSVHISSCRLSWHFSYSLLSAEKFFLLYSFNTLYTCHVCLCQETMRFQSRYCVFKELKASGGAG